MLRTCGTTWGLAIALAATQPAAYAVASTRDIADLSLEELAAIEVTSVSRRSEPLNAAPASIYVISAEAIRRAGVDSLAEALRLAPNLQVARIDATQYAVSARGFNNAIGNKLLVLIDGRTVYTPFFSGVFWDQQDLLLDDVERIEVISGPGATLWGANAVNGVINVITRESADTQGLLAVASGGTDRRGASLRYGGALGETAHMRVYAKTAKLNNTERANGSALADGNERHQIGFRADWNFGRNALTVQGDTYRTHAESRGSLGSFDFTPVTSEGTNVLGRWTHQLGGGGTLQAQAYVDHTERDDAVIYKPNIDLADLELQHSFNLDAHKLVWGGGYRRAHDTIRPGFFLGFVPESRTLSWSNLFVQDDFTLRPGLDLTVGLKLERNDYTGTETLPNLRLAWQPGIGGLLWGALSRAVRAPARLDRDIRLPPAGPPFIIAGGPNFESEVANVLELGYRAQPSTDWNYAITAFVHDWHGLRSGQPPPNAQVQNMIDGKTYGVEAWAAWHVLPKWRLRAGLSTLHKDLHLQAGSTDPVGPANLGDDPDYQWSVQSSFNFTERQMLDMSVRRVASLPQAAVPAYSALDMRYGWQLTREVELSLVGRNLLDPGHPEFEALPNRSEIGRSITLQLRYAL